MEELFISAVGPTENDFMISNSFWDNKFNFPIALFGDNNEDSVKFSK